MLSVVAAAISRVVGGPATLPWGEMLVKHSWSHIPANWVTLGHPPDDASIDFHIALKPDREKALTDALLEVSQPGSTKRVLFTSPPFEAYFGHLFQIWRTPHKATGCSACCAASRYVRTCDLLAEIQRCPALLHFNDTWRLLADGRWGSCLPS